MFYRRHIRTSATAWIHVADQKWNTPHHILLPPTGLEISNTGGKVFCSRNTMPPKLKHILRSKRIKLTLTPNLFIVCTFTDLIDWANEGRLWTMKRHWCSVLGDRLPLDRHSFAFLDQPSSFLISSFLLGGLSFLFPQLFSFNQTPSRTWALLTRSAKSFKYNDIF